jgi:type VI secretion system protein ImpF
VAGLTAQERLQPSLLDRLTDSDPSASRESLDARVLSKQQLRAAVLRDLSWLFNTTCQEPPLRSRDVDGRRMWQEAPEARKSVLNYGLPPLSGETMIVMDFPWLEQQIREAIIRFEPRVDPDSLAVSVTDERMTGKQPTMLRLVIRGLMWNQPVPLELLLSADVDVDTGQTAVRDMRG